MTDPRTEGWVLGDVDAAVLGMCDGEPRLTVVRRRTRRHDHYYSSLERLWHRGLVRRTRSWFVDGDNLWWAATRTADGEQALELNRALRAA